MPSKGRKFITEFLIPSLNDKRFGSRLKWLDIEKEVFQMQWNHKSAQNWTINDAVVFAAWDKRRGHYNPSDKEYYSKSKQRFRAALYKFIRLRYITELCSTDRYTKIFCIGDGGNISNAYIIVSKSMKDNNGKESKSQREVTQPPENLATDSKSFWAADQLIEPQESCLQTCFKNGTNEEFFKDEQVVADNSNGFSYTLDSLESFFHSNLSNDMKENFVARENSNILKESDLKNLQSELQKSETNIYMKDNYLKREPIEKDNFQDYLSIVIYPSQQMEWPEIADYGINEEFSYNLLVE